MGVVGLYGMSEDLGFGKPVTKGMIKAGSSAKLRSCSRTKYITIFRNC